MTCIYLLWEDNILLLYRQGSRVINNMWTGSAGGHFEENELNDAKACILRELKEELSLTEAHLRDLELRYLTIRNTAGELRLNYYFFAVLPDGTNMNLKSNEGMLKWFSLEEIRDLEMPFSAGYVIRHYLHTGRYNHLLYGGVSNGGEIIFTKLSEN